MTTEEIVRALRYCAGDNPCGTCSVQLSENEYVCIDMLFKRAAEALEQLTTENADLRKEIEWKDMTIAHAQRKQAEAEAERDALLDLMKAHRACYACKRADCCNGSNADVVDCMLCTEVACPCVGCRDSSHWEWRGLPETPEEGEKA